MTEVTIIIDEEGKFQSAYSNSECDVTVLQRGQKDQAIDEVEANLEEIEVK